MMKTKYFSRQGVLAPQIIVPPASGLDIVIVVPCFNEPDLLMAMKSLIPDITPQWNAEVIIVINHADDSVPEVKLANSNTYEVARKWAAENSTDQLRFFILYHQDIPTRQAGVGRARKIGMDEAARRLLDAGNANGVIAAYDADCTCVSDHISQIVQAFKNPSLEGVSIDFAHRIDSAESDESKAIIDYESHLRYFVNGQRWAGFPFAYQTIGSSMAVRADTYVSVGGMNTRKAGEDFYFLHKFIERGKFADLHSTTVFPSSRRSDRVPFGTGKAVADILDGKGSVTYNPKSFVDLKALIDGVPDIYTGDINTFLEQQPDSTKEYLLSVDFSGRVEEIRNNVSSQEAFTKRFYRWFNAFRLMKYMHFARDHYYGDVSVEEGLKWLFAHWYEQSLPTDSLVRLEIMRSEDKQYQF